LYTLCCTTAIAENKSYVYYDKGETIAASLSIYNDVYNFSELDPDIDKLSIIILDGSMTKISSDIKVLKNLKSIGISGYYEGGCSNFGEDYGDVVGTIDLPQELFELPLLERLNLACAHYTASAFESAEIIQSNIKNIVLWRLCDASFITKLDSVINLSIDYRKEIPEYIYGLKKLQKLFVGSREIDEKKMLHISDKLCDMQDLEELNFTGHSVELPFCKDKLKKVTSLTMSFSGRKEKLGDKEYYFPVKILQFENLENLSLALCGRFELPPYRLGPQKLKKILLDSNLDRYGNNDRSCAEGDGKTGLNILNLSEYPNLEEAMIYNTDIFDDNVGNPPSMTLYDLARKNKKEFNKRWDNGQKAFIKNITTAIKRGKLPHLKEVVIPDRNAQGDDEFLTVFPFEEK
jgi:hypothetical protein